MRDKARGNMIAAVIVAWLLLNIAIACWLTWVRVVRPDREQLRRERELQSIGDGFSGAGSCPTMDMVSGRFRN